MCSLAFWSARRSSNLPLKAAMSCHEVLEPVSVLCRVTIHRAAAPSRAMVTDLTCPLSLGMSRLYSSMQLRTQARKNPSYWGALLYFTPKSGTFWSGQWVLLHLALCPSPPAGVAYAGVAAVAIASVASEALMEGPGFASSSSLHSSSTSFSTSEPRRGLLLPL